MSLETSDKFRRQRTRLLTISIVLLFYHFLRLQFKHVNILGTQVDIGSPNRVTWVLWIGWGYWLWRYCSHFLDISDRGIQSTYVAKLSVYALTEARKRFEREPPAEMATIMVRGFPAERVVTWNANPNLLRNYMGIPRSFTIRFFGDCSDDVGGMVQQQHVIQAPIRWFNRLGALWHLLFIMPHGSEYFLPFLVALFPVLFWTDQWIATSCSRP